MSEKIGGRRTFFVIVLFDEVNNVDLNVVMSLWIGYLWKTESTEATVLVYYSTSTLIRGLKWLIQIIPSNFAEKLQLFCIIDTMK